MTPLLTLPEVAAIFRKSKSWVRRQAAAGRLVTLKVGGSIRFRSEDVEAYLKASRLPAVHVSRGKRSPKGETKAVLDRFREIARKELNA